MKVFIKDKYIVINTCYKIMSYLRLVKIFHGNPNTQCIITTSALNIKNVKAFHLLCLLCSETDHYEKQAQC